MSETYIGTKTAAEVEAMVAEMSRKPDAHLLVEFLDELLGATLDPEKGAVLRLTNAYFVGLDDEAGA